ncbi:MAG TPA: methylenetetrahydrofolate reductase [Stellaceae bacterium]|jgi:methylenetetrahydrofolate reductase (NADPH)
MSLSALQSRLAGGDFIVTAEVTPQVATDPADFVAKAVPLKGLATAVNVTDGAGAKAHMATLVAAHFLNQAGVEPIMQMACRDKNRIALESELLGAQAIGIRNFLVLTGDDPKAGDQPDAKPVFDFNSTNLLQMAQKMRAEKKLPPGTDIKGEVSFAIGATDVPVDPPKDWNPKSLMAKLDAGADFIQTQFCMDIEVVKRYGARLVELGIAPKLGFLIGLCPIPSAKSAIWMKEKLFGTNIPDALVKRIEGATDQRVEGRKICIELMQQMVDVPGIAGVHIMAPVNPSAIPGVIEESGVTKKKRART